MVEQVKESCPSSELVGDYVAGTLTADEMRKRIKDLSALESLAGMQKIYRRM
jgi:hypothetical protein